MHNFTHKHLKRGLARLRSRKQILMLLMAAMLTSFSSFAQPLSGTYTICPTGCDFSSYTAAFSALGSRGVGGPVLFNVSADNYNESITRSGAITGASATNTITFKGAGKYATRVYSSTATRVANFTSLQWVRFEDMAFEYTGSSTSRYTVYLSSCKNLVFKNCMLKMPTTSSNYNLYQASCNNNLFENNRFEGGYYSIYNSEYNSSYLYGGHTFKNNSITKFYYYSMYNYGSGKNTYDGNYIDSSMYQYNYFYSYYEGGATYKNNIWGPTNAYYRYLYYPNNFSSSTPFQFYNNIVNMANTTSYYGFYVYSYGISNVNMQMYHNTFRINNGSGYGIYLYNYSSSGYDIRNNSFNNTGGGAAAYFYNPAGFSKLEYNNFYTSGSGNLVYYNGWHSNITSYKQAAASNGHGAGATNVQLPFISSTDLHLDQTKPAPSGKSVGITTDIDGDSRCMIFPTVGADESMMGKTNFTGNFFGPDTVFSGSPTVFFNVAKEGEPKIFRWYINGTRVQGRAGDSIHLATTSLTGTTASISLVTVGCAKTDSVTKTVIITQPTAVPVVDFIGSTYQIMKGETVKFTDLSTNGPSQWSWNISPNMANIGGTPTARYQYIYGSDKTPVNEVRFDVAGKYAVCLTTSNSVGTGQTVCKQAYVEVIETLNMCDQTVTRLDKGYLYDDGGPSAGYSPNNKCNLLIAPCADTIFFVLKTMDSYCYDYLRVYDGTSNKGKPLHTKCASNGFVGGGTYTCNPSCRPQAGGDTLMATSGSIYVEWDATYQYTTSAQGFEAYWYSLPKLNVALPVAKFEVPDSVCINNTVALINKTTGSFVEYMWDLDGDPSTMEDDATNTEVTFFQTGTQRVTLVAQNCAGTDTFSKDIVVYTPTTPAANFFADNLNPTTNDIVKLFNSTKECVDSVIWDITGTGNVKFVGGTDKRSFDPQVMFDTKGCYSVSLTVYNSSTAGSNVAFKNCYITVKDAYCTPGAATLIPDVGISRVKFADLDSKSDVAKTDYTNYVNSRSATVEKGSKYKLTVERIATANTMTRNAWIDWNGDGDFDDAGEMLGEERNAKTLSWSVDVTIPTTAITGASVLRVATNFGNLSNKVCGQNQYGEYEDYRIYINMDVTAPVVTLKGMDTVYLEQNYAYVDSGATAMDNVDGDITSKITSVFAPKFFKGIPGTYKQTYSVKDAAGNTGSATRIVIVVADRIAPFLTVNSTDTVKVRVNTSFIEPAATAIDSVDGPLNAQITKSYNPAFDISKVGTYLLTYSVTDDAQNTATKTIVVMVVDDVKPEIVLNGKDTIYHEVGTPFTDPGATVSDNYDQNVQVSAFSNVNANVVGMYSIIYSATDASGNKADQVTRTVIVGDTKAPVISLNGDSVVTLDVNTTFNDPGVTFSDNYDKNMTVVKSGSFMTSFPDMYANTLGNFEITYTVTDASGNTAMVTRKINVVDRTAPVITLKGFPVVDKVCRWSSYTDAGYDLKDNYYTSTQITVTMESSRTDSTQREGAWAIRYKAVDPSGNTSYSPYRLINVELCVSGVEETATDNGNVQIYPNPNTGMFTIDVNLPKQEYVKISVLNMLGQEVRVVNNSMMHSGKFNVDLTGEKAGMYFINITSQGNTITKKVNVTK